MRIVPSSIPGVDIVAPDSPELAALVPPESLPFTVIVRNAAAQTVAFIGMRFDLTGARGEKYSVVHYADMLRFPENAELRPGTVRAICAEPSYTAGNPDARGKLNLNNLQRMLSIRASLDCVAFADGRFEGTDFRGAFSRLNQEREAERTLVESVLAADDPRGFLKSAGSDPLARKLAEADDIRAATRAHRLRIELWRA